MNFSIESCSFRKFSVSSDSEISRETLMIKNIASSFLTQLPWPDSDTFIFIFLRHSYYFLWGN